MIRITPLTAPKSVYKAEKCGVTPPGIHPPFCTSPIKKDFLVRIVAEMYGVSRAYARMVLDGVRHNDALLHSYGELAWAWRAAIAGVAARVPPKALERRAATAPATGRHGPATGRHGPPASRRGA